MGEHINWMIFSIFKCFGQISFYKCTFGNQYLIFGQFQGVYGRLILKKYDVFNSIQFILIVFLGESMALFTPEVTWHEYSNGIGSEDFASPPDEISVFT